MRNRVILVIIAGIVAAGGVWAFRHFNPYQICLRVNTQEAMSSGQGKEQAAQFAEGLCKAKMPLQN